MKRKAGGQAANSPEGAATPVSQMENRNSLISSSQNSIDSASEQQRRQREYEAKVRKSLDLTHLVNYLREVCNQDESESDSELSDNGTSSYLPSSPLSGLMSSNIHNHSSVPGLLTSEDGHPNQADGMTRSVHDNNPFGPIDLLNENSSSTISDDHLRYNSNQSRAASKVGKAMFNSAPVSLISSARSSINGSVTTKSSYSSSNSTLSDEDSSQRLGNESQDDSSEDEPSANNSDSDADSALPMTDSELSHLIEASNTFTNVGLAAEEQLSIKFIDALHAASRHDKRKASTSKDQLKKFFGLNKGKGKMSEAMRNRIRKKSISFKTEQTIAGAMSTFKTPKNFVSGKVAPTIKLERLEPVSKALKTKSEPVEAPSPAKRRRKRLSPGALEDTSSLSEQVMDMNTSQSTASLDSYFKDEKKVSVTTKARSTSSTSSLDKFNIDSPDLKSKKLSPQRKLELLSMLNQKRKSVYILICKRDIPKAYKNRLNLRNEKIAAAKRLGFTAIRNTKEKSVVTESKDKKLTLIDKSPSRPSVSSGQDSPLQKVEEIGSTEPEQKINEIVKFCSLSMRQKVLYESIQDKIKEFVYSNSENETGLAAHVAALRLVCNHAELLAGEETRSPFRHQVNVFYPKLLFCDTIAKTNYGSELAHQNKLSIYHAQNIHSSLFPKVQSEDLNVSSKGDLHSEWSFLRLIGTHLAEFYEILYGEFGASLRHLIRMRSAQVVKNHQHIWLDESDCDSKLTNDLLLIDHERPMSAANILQSPLLNKFILTPGTTNTFVGSSDGTRTARTTLIPQILYCYYPKVSTKRLKVYFRGGSTSSSVCPWKEPNYVADKRAHVWRTLSSLLPDEEAHIWNGIPSFSEIISPMRNGVAGSGKLPLLDELLTSLKKSGNCVLILTELPDMIKLLEKFLTYRKWLNNNNFVQVCITSQVYKLWEERKPDEPTPDTIIFYDSNFEICTNNRMEKAIGRVQELSKSGSVTVFRLICKGTIEEELLKEVTGTQGNKSNQDEEAVKSLPEFSILSLIAKNQQLQKGTGADVLKAAENDYCNVAAHSSLKSNQSTNKPNIVPEYSRSPTAPLIKTFSAQADDGSQKKYDDDDSSDMDEESEDEERVGRPLRAIDSSTKKLPSRSLDFESSDDEELALLPKPRKISRGMGKRGRPPTRIRFRHRDYDGRRPGRPRLKPFGPQNQATRGRGPGRPPLTRKLEPLQSHSAPPVVASQSVFDYNSSDPDLESS